MNENDVNISIVHEGGHYVGYIDGWFVCSGDTYNEVRKELIDILSSKNERVS